MDEDRYVVITIIAPDGSDIFDQLTATDAVDVEEVYGSYGETTYEEARQVADTLRQFAQGL